MTKDNKIELACLVALALYSGRRRMELARMKVSDFDNLAFNGTMYKTSPIKTKDRCGGKMLECYVMSEFKPYLEKWLAIKPDSEWLFPNSRCPENHITADSIYAEYIKKKGYSDKYFYCHSLRHLFVTNLARKGIPGNIIQDIVGWDSADMLKVYSDITKDEKIAQYFGNNVNI